MYTLTGESQYHICYFIRSTSLRNIRFIKDALGYEISPKQRSPIVMPQEMLDFSHAGM